MGGGSDRKVTRGEIRKVGTDIQRQVTPHLDAALTQVRTASGLDRGMFTCVSWTFAGAYLGIVQFATQDLDTKKQDAVDVKDALNRVASKWDEAEQRSTVREDG